MCVGALNMRVGALYSLPPSNAAEEPESGRAALKSAGVLSGVTPKPTQWACPACIAAPNMCQKERK